MLHISRKLTHSKHHSRIGSKIGLSSVPESQVTYDDAAFLHDWLRGWPNLPTSLEQVFLDSSASAVTVFAFLVGNSGVIVRTEPNFSRTILRSHGDQGNVNDKSEWDRGMVEIRIIVSRLGRRGGCFGRGQSCIARHELQRRSGSEFG